MIYKLLTDQIVITSQNTCSNAVLVRVTNPTSAIVNCAIVPANGAANLNFAVLANSEIIVSKARTDTVIGTGLYASGIAFKH